VDVGTSGVELLNRPKQDLVGKTVHEVFPAEVAQLLTQANQEALGEQRVVQLCYTLPIERRPRRFEADVAPLDAEQTLWLIRDVTEQFEQAQRESAHKQFVTDILDAMDAAVVVLAPSGEILFENAAWRGLFQSRPHPPVGANYLEAVENYCCMSPGDAEALRTNVQRLIEGRIERFSQDYRSTWEGHSRWFVVRGNPFNEPVPRPVVIRHLDITERKQVEESLRESQSRYHNLFANSPDGILVTMDGVIYLANDAASELIGGATPDQLIGQRLVELFDPSSVELLKERLDRCQAGYENYPPWEAQLKGMGHGASSIPVEVSLNSFRLRSKRGVHVILRDIRSRVAAEGERRRLQVAVENLEDGVIITDPSGTIQYVNPAYERVTGYSREELIGQNCKMLKSGQHDPAFYQTLWATITSGRTWRGRFVNRRRSGTLYTEEATISPVFDSNGHITHFVAVKRDVTDRLRLEEELARAARLEAIGQLAAGLAHDLNNVLAGILGETELGLQECPSYADELRERFQQVRNAVARGTDLTRRLLGFARRQQIQPRPLDLNRAIEDLRSFLQRLIGEHIELVWTPTPQSATVNLDPAQVTEVLMNLCVNARDAIERHGVIDIKTEVEELTPEMCHRHADMRPGRFVVLTVSDTGCGMSTEVLSHLFEPFFTTKPPDKGTGLGLATVYGIVKQNRGFIHVYSEVGRGTTFRLYFPYCFEKPVEASPPRPTVPALGRGETILLVEDDASILKLSAAMLERLGYHVMAVQDPETAICIAESEGNRIRLVITDVLMPHMDGRELVERLRQINPALRSLFMSGFTANVIAHEGILAPGTEFIQKPFTMAEFALKVRQCLENPESPAP